MAERVFHDWLSRRLNNPDHTVMAGVGVDDCAHVETTPHDKLALSTDTVVEGVHFDAEADPLAIGGKAVTAALSDLAASGCRPLWGLVALTLRRGMGERWAMRLMEGIAAVARTYGLVIVGGDTASAYGPASINLTVVGTPYSQNPVRRDQARPGDKLILTGELGGSFLGRHMRPIPRFAEIERVLQITPVTAGIDLSDGLSTDLTRLATASNVGAVIEEHEIPISTDAKRLAATSGKTPLEHALHDGEDFELLLTISAEGWEALRSAWPQSGCQTRLSCIGHIERDTGINLASREGTLTRLEALGYEHAF